MMRRHLYAGLDVGRTYQRKPHLLLIKGAKTMKPREDLTFADSRSDTIQLSSLVSLPDWRWHAASCSPTS